MWPGDGCAATRPAEPGRPLAASSGCSAMAYAVSARLVTRIGRSLERSFASPADGRRRPLGSGGGASEPGPGAGALTLSVADSLTP
jgi:hypothetical protein